MRRWYLIHTKPRKERVAEQNLQSQNYEVYLPLIQQEHRRHGHWTEVIEPLFPRYIFVRLELGHDDIRPICYTKGVQNFVRFTENPAIVSDQVIESLKDIEDRNGGLHYPDGSLFGLGDEVIIDQGPLAGLKAVFLAETGQERVIILLNIMSRESRITVERDQLRLA